VCSPHGRLAGLHPANSGISGPPVARWVDDRGSERQPQPLRGCASRCPTSIGSSRYPARARIESCRTCVAAPARRTVIEHTHAAGPIAKALRIDMQAGRVCRHPAHGTHQATPEQRRPSSWGRGSRVVGSISPFSLARGVVKDRATPCLASLQLIEIAKVSRKVARHGLPPQAPERFR